MAAAEDHLCSSINLLLLLLLSVLSLEIASAGSIVKTLPGFPGELPFYLETGYVGVGENEEVQLFYLFVRSERNPSVDPLMLWLTGGPGCSTLTSFFYSNGPLSFKIQDYKGGLPILHLNEYSWTKSLNIIYLDAPVGTGFSYSTTQAGYNVDDYKSTAQIYEFLNKWLMDHPEYLENNLYVGGDSYSGITVPMIVQQIYYSNPSLNLQGYLLGNPLTDSYIDENSRVPFAYRLTLISDELYKSAKKSCNGDYVTVNASNEQCISDMDSITELISQIYPMQVLEPKCGITSLGPNERGLDQRSLIENPADFLLNLGEKSAYYCHEYRYWFCKIWANDKGVREALHLREGTVGHWVMCYGPKLSYTRDVTSSVAYHRNLTDTGLRALIYSGDHDMIIPHIGTQEWIHLLNLSEADAWRAWYTDGQVAGYAQRFTNEEFALTYATVKGAGHIAMEYKPKECDAMIKRWFAYYPL